MPNPTPPTISLADVKAWIQRAACQFSKASAFAQTQRTNRTSPPAVSLEAQTAALARAVRRTIAAFAAQTSRATLTTNTRSTQHGTSPQPSDPATVARDTDPTSHQ